MWWPVAMISQLRQEQRLLKQQFKEAEDKVQSTSETLSFHHFMMKRDLYNINSAEFHKWSLAETDWRAPRDLRKSNQGNK